MTVAAGPRVPLQGTNLMVSPLCLGGNRFGSTLDEDESFALLDEFAELGGNFIDTALVYANWLDGIESSCSERTLGRWLTARGNRNDIIVATKGGHHALSTPTVPRLDAKSLRADVTASIEHLGGDPIQLYYLHRDAPQCQMEEILEILEGFVDEGLIHHYAASNFSASRLAHAQTIAAETGVSGFVANQLEWSLAQPRPETVAPDLTWMDAELAAFHAASHMTAIPYSSQARGYFDKVQNGRPPSESVRRYDSPYNAKTAEIVHSLARRYEVDNTTLALAGLLHTAVPTIPVIGCRTVEQLRLSWSALDVRLDQPDQIKLSHRALVGRTAKP